MALHFPEQSAMASTTLRKTLRSRGHRSCFVGGIESGERRVDVIEFIESARVLGVDPRQLFAKVLD